MPTSRYGRVLLVGLVLLTAVALWQTRDGTPALALVNAHPQRVMGTDCTLVAAVAPGDIARAQKALEAAEAVIRDVEARMSVYVEASELSRLNRAVAGENVPLTADTLGVLRIARDAASKTAGAFDATCPPVLLLWKDAGERGKRPSEDALSAAREATGWTRFELTSSGAQKKMADARLDLGGIAKGHAIDRTVGALKKANVKAGLVEIGGDVRVFGPGPKGQGWAVHLRHPFRKGSCGTIELQDAAVCTSGSYQRFTEIEGQRYSHIIDPRTARPVQDVPSVTVVAPDCITADIWATALSVLGPEGLEKLAAIDGLEALLITGRPEDFAIHQTPGFARLLRDPLRLE